MDHSSADKKRLLIVVFVLSFCSIIYEIMLARVFSVLSDRPTVWQALTIGVFVGSLGLGVFAARRIKQENSVNTLFLIEIILSIVGSCGVAIVYVSYVGYKLWILGPLGRSLIGSSVYPIDLFNGFLQIITVIIGFLSGFELPLCLNIAERLKLKKSLNTIFAANYFGTLMGTLIVVFLLLPALDFSWSAAVIGSLNLITAFVIYGLGDRQSKIHYIGVLMSAAVIFSVALLSPSLHQSMLKARYYVTVGRQIKPETEERNLSELLAHPTVKHFKSTYQNLDIVPYDSKNPQRKDDFILFLDQHYQFDSAFADLYHELFVHVPINMAGKIPKNILLLGAGDGIAAKELLKYGDRIEKIHMVELDPMMLRLANEDEDFLRVNKGALQHEKIKLTMGDAMTYLRQTREKFDAIFIDFPYPFNFDLSRLYSIEFYASARKTLKDDGFLVYDVPIFPKHELTEKNQQYNNIIGSTIHYAGFESFYGYGGQTNPEDRETFILAFPHKKTPQIEPQFLFTELNLKIVNERNLRKIANQRYPFEPTRSLVHSIFKPKLLMLRDSRL